ncbi:MAG: response regulator receiver protein [Arcobacter sp.]|nr:MAG: response regulator receiver protein [Arcobacter sp.]
MKNNNNFMNSTFDPENFNILILEDSKSINKILTERFKILKYKCFNAYTISEANQILDEEQIDYIMLDLNLPDGNGAQIIERFKDSNTKIFLLTSENNKLFIDESYRKGIIDFIHKDKDFFHKIEDITNTIEKLEKNKLKTILIVDDSKIIQYQLQDILSNRHYKIELASDTKEAYKIIQEKKINLILLDVQLKNSNGIEFLKKNKLEIINKKKIPVLIISGHVDSTIIREGLKNGAVDVIKKPYIFEEIILKVDLWIDYKRKEEEIQNSTKLLNQYKETVDRSSLVYKTDPKGNIIYVNEEFCKISEYTKNELLGKKLDILRDTEMKKDFFNNLWSSINEKKRAWKGKIKNKTKSGKYFWVNTIINPIFNTQNELVECIAISTNITQNELINNYFKDQLSSSNQNLEYAMNKTEEYKKAMYKSNIVSIADLNGKITFVNEQFCKISEYSEDELLGNSHSIVRHEDMDNHIFKELWKTIKEGRTWNGIIKNCSKTGRTYWVDTTIVPIKDKNENIIEYMSIRNDLTELFELHKEIEETQKEIIYRMGEIGETRSNETGQHVKRVALYSKLLATYYGLNEEKIDLLFTASPMHDIGKVGIPDSILKKPGKLTDNEFEFMKKHAELGYNILKNSKRKVLKAAAIVSYEHHEKWDGTGYPRGKKGEEIHIFGRITAIADVFDALASDRCYKKAWEDEKIFKLFEDEKGKSFEPKLIDLLFENKDKFIEIREQYKD